MSNENPETLTDEQLAASFVVGQSEHTSRRELSCIKLHQEVLRLLQDIIEWGVNVNGMNISDLDSLWSRAKIIVDERDVT